MAADFSSQSHVPPLEQSIGDYLISDAPARLDPTAIHAYLTRSYWCPQIPLETVRRALANSFCIGAYSASGEQVGLTRFITDYATFCYVCDVYVLEDHRGHGLAKAMMAMASSHPRLQGLRRWNLVTRDAHALYAQFGFQPVAKPEGYMEKLDRDIYLRNTPPAS